MIIYLQRLATVVSLSFFLMFPTLSWSQVSLGIRSGISINSFWITPDAVNIHEKTGLEVAVPLEIRLNEWLALQPELGYSQRGVKYSRSNPLEEARSILRAQTGNVSLDYLQAPFLVKFAPLSRRYFSFEAFTGPSLAVLLNAQSLETFGDNSENPPQVRTLQPSLSGGDIKGVDIGWVIGTGISYRPHGRNLSRRYRGELLLDARYVIGTTQLDPNWLDGNVRNRSLSITLGYKIQLGK